jgi:hypothetical protein
MITALTIALGAQLTLAAAPQRVCINPRTGYPNVDLVVKNPTDTKWEISEIRGMVFDASGTLLERRLIWQDSLRATRPDNVIDPKSEAIIFNALAFNTAAPGRQLRFEVDVSPAASPLAVDLTPVDCSVGQPRLMLPLTGRVLVYDGYDALSHHRRSDFRGNLADVMGITGNFQRFGMDLVVVDREGRLWRGDGKKTSDWYGWGQPVRAAAAGTVVAMHDGQPDNVELGTVDKWGGPKKEEPMSSYGNFVLLDHGGGEFTLYGHMRNGSVKVSPKQKVAAGEALGGVGNSGASGGVHLHWERRRGRGFGLSDIETQPAYVHGVELIGNPSHNPDVPLVIDTGDVLIVRN